jgi:hypothetical protein
MDNDERMVESTAETQRPSAADVSGAEFFFFRMQSSWCATKYMGSLSAGDRPNTWKAFRGFFSLTARNPEFRKYARKISPSPGTLRQFFRYLGYGLYVGRKV